MKVTIKNTETSKTIREPGIGQHFKKKGCRRGVVSHAPKCSKAMASWTSHELAQRCPAVCHQELPPTTPPRQLRFLGSRSSRAALVDLQGDGWEKGSGAWTLVVVHTIY